MQLTHLQEKNKVKFMLRILEKFMKDPKQDPDPDTNPKPTEK